MKTNLHRPASLLGPWLAAIPFAVALALSGCATKQEVGAIVSQSNAAMLAGQFGLPAPGLTATGKEPWEEASERIEAFIADHPDQPATAAPLRVRQAMMLLGHKQFNLARAAFAQAKIGDLHTDRDKALKESADTLVWWFASSKKDTWSDDDDQVKAGKALDQLARTQRTYAGSTEIRDYLAEMRAWIGILKAKHTTSEDDGRKRLKDALDVYAEIFQPEELAILTPPAAGTEPLPDPGIPADGLRRRARVKAVLEYARDVNKQGDLAVHPENAIFDRFINQ